MKLKKIVSAALAFLMLSGCIMIGSASAADDEGLPFKDVGKKKWFYDAVKYVYDGGLMNGTTADKFEPNANLSRAMFITILGRLAGAETKESDVFPDIKKNSWYSGYVGWAVEAGVVKGYDDGTFKPNKSLSRQEMAVAVDRFITYLDCRMTTGGGMWNFTDQKKVASWAKDSLAVLRNSGVVEGDQYGNFNPKNNITRAEAATIIMKLQKAIANAWQGYLPEDGAEPIVLGASYMYWTGNACTGGMAHDLDKSGDLPVLKSNMDRYAAVDTYLPVNSVGTSLSYMKIDVAKYPIVKVAYRFDGAENTVPAAEYICNITRTETAGFREAVTFTAGTDDAGFKTATADLSAIPAAHADYFDVVKLSNLVFEPFAEDYSGEATFDILYLGFFKTQAEADAFTSSSNEDIADYLKNYEPYTTLNWKEYTAEDAAYYDKLLADRIKEIKNSESAITPEMIEAAGGTCYYLSSINGDDSNDGLSPETPWKSLSKLIDIKVPGVVELSVADPGDGVFFERGSEWYAEKYHNTTVSTLSTGKGVTYGAYGEGTKPLFTCAIDFRGTRNNNGDWEETEWDNVYLLEKLDPNPEWEFADKRDIGNIFFNGGEGLGIRIIPKDAENPFGEGKTGYDKGYCCNGYEYFYTGTPDFTSPGTALKNNLEFIYDSAAGKLYLYFDKGNPADYFDDIKVARNGTAAWASEGCTFDNLAFMYSTDYCVRSDGFNMVFQNCEIGCVGGSLSSVESGIEMFGASDEILMYNNYIHDVGDGPLTSQCSSPVDGQPNHIQNVSYIDNVIVGGGCGAEIWNHMGPIDENGYAQNKITNITIRGNIMAYCGYGLTQKQATGSNQEGGLINSSMYQEMGNNIVEDNIFMHGTGAVFYAYVATYDQGRGWMAKNNTYIYNDVHSAMVYSYETINYLNHGMWKRVRVAMPYDYETLVWLTGNGVDPMGTYYHYSDMNEHEEKQCFFITGYYAERGGFELK